MELTPHHRPTPPKMPDIASETTAKVAGKLSKVGMASIEMPVRIPSSSGAINTVPAKVDAYVSLDNPNAKGIHMSRLFLILQNYLPHHEVGLEAINELLQSFITSHHGISKCSYIKISFDYLTQRRALLSDHLGWRSYPVHLWGSLDQSGKARFDMGVQVSYSSTCPCSAALARHVIQDQFSKDFSGVDQVSASEVLKWLGKEESICATPHGQRSYADVRVVPKDLKNALSFVEIIDLVEGALKTPVQATVKREDEQEFARLNGENLMFCEDAARRVKAAFDADSRIEDYLIKATHQESLHPHDAVSFAVKGLEGGFRP